MSVTRSREYEDQRAFWSAELESFDSIYSGAKGRVRVFLDSIFRRDMFQRFSYAMEQARPIEGRRFLDVGCGTGRYAIPLAEGGATKVVGLDISEQMVKKCLQRAASAGVADRATFVASDLLEYTATGTYDVILGIGLFDYIRDPRPVLTKMRELTDDVAILTFPRRWTWRAPVRRVRLALRGCYVRFYSASEVRKLLAQAGFDSCDLLRVGKLYCVTARPGNGG